MEGNLRFKINWASLVVGRKFTVFALFSLEFEGNFQVQAPGELIFGGAIEWSVFCVTRLGGLYLEGLIHGGAYFRNFTVAKVDGIEKHYCTLYHVTGLYKIWTADCRLDIKYGLPTPLVKMMPNWF